MNFKVNIPLLVIKRSKYWVAFSPHLKTYGYSSENAEGAINDFDRAIETFFYVHEKLNNLKEVLSKLGWVRQDNSYDLPKLLNTDLGYSSFPSERVNHQIAVPIM